MSAAMGLRQLFGFPLSIPLLLMAPGWDLAAAPSPAGYARRMATDVELAANAPWLVVEIDTAGNTGQYASVAVSDTGGTPVVSCYDADDGDLRVAKLVSYGGNCSPGGSWSCWTIDGEGDVGRCSCDKIDPFRQCTKYRYGDCVSIDVDESGLATIAYQRSYIAAGRGSPAVAYQGPFRASLPMVL
ncbi:MAG: hypothetical protein PVH41_14215, partial [Anaerolineae bacterium]